MGGGGDVMKGEAAGVHSRSAGSAAGVGALPSAVAGGATFGRAAGVGALPNPAGIRRRAAWAFCIGEHTSGHSCIGDAPGVGVGGATNDPAVGGIHRCNGRGPGSHASFTTSKPADTQL